jgi:hypothetical protein
MDNEENYLAQCGGLALERDVDIRHETVRT